MNIKDDESGIYENKKVIITTITIIANNIIVNNISRKGGYMEVFGKGIEEKNNTNIFTTSLKSKIFLLIIMNTISIK